MAPAATTPPPALRRRATSAARPRLLAVAPTAIRNPNPVPPLLSSRFSAALSHMSRFRVALHVVPRRGLLDPQGKAVADALHTLGFTTVHDVHVGRHLIVEMDADNPPAAEKTARAMCE